MDVTPPTIEELQSQVAESTATIDGLNAQEQSRQAQLQQMQQQANGRLQQSSATVINTMGQLAMLEELKTTQVAAMHRDEGIAQAINSMLPQQ